MDDEWLRLSLLQHHAYCPRQAWLINDGVWLDNHLTVIGSAEHLAVDAPGRVSRRGVRVHHHVELASHQHRIYRYADAVEEFQDGSLMPVEHKHGRGAGDVEPSVIQAVAQAMCLLEMTGRPVPRVALYVTAERHREFHDVEPFRGAFEDCLKAARQTLSGPLPLGFPPRRQCRNCSIVESCQPPVVRGRS